MGKDGDNFGDSEYYYNYSVVYKDEFNSSDSSELSNSVFTSEGLPEGNKRGFGSGNFVFVVVFGISVLSIFLNVGTIFVIFTPKKIRPVNYLIANMSFVCILLSILGVMYFWDKEHPTFYGTWLCGLMSLARNLLVGVVSLTVMGISYERVKSLKPRIKRLLATRTLFTIWIVAFVVVTPTYFTNIARTSPGEPPGCQTVSPLGLVSLGIVFEVFRFTVFHFLVSLFMTFELYQVRSKLRYLYLFKAIPSERMRRKVQKIRFIYLNSVTFIGFWLPMGGILSFYKIIRRYSQPNTTNTNNARTDRSASYQYVYLAILTVFYFYILIIPVIILWTNEDLKRISWFWKPVNSNMEAGNEGHENAIETLEMGTTFAKTSDSVAVLSHTLSNKCAVVEVKVIASDKDGNLEEDLVKMTTKPCHTIEVQVHEEIDPGQLSPLLHPKREQCSGSDSVDSLDET